MNTSEHTKTTMNGGRDGGQNHSLAKRIKERPRSINAKMPKVQQRATCIERAILSRVMRCAVVDLMVAISQRSLSLSLRGQVIEYQRSSRPCATSGSKRTALGLTSRQSAAKLSGRRQAV